LGADLYQKILQVDDFGGLQPTYMISRWWNFGTRGRTDLGLPPRA